VVAESDTASFADNLSAMTDDELFQQMRSLEQESEKRSKESGDDLDEILGRIALVEQAIEERFPGQALAPYKQWQRDALL
jgi:hypothetical protein